MQPTCLQNYFLHHVHGVCLGAWWQLTRCIVVTALARGPTTSHHACTSLTLIFKILWSSTSWLCVNYIAGIRCTQPNVALDTASTPGYGRQYTQATHTLAVLCNTLPLPPTVTCQHCTVLGVCYLTLPWGSFSACCYTTVSSGSAACDCSTAPLTHAAVMTHTATMTHAVATLL